MWNRSFRDDKNAWPSERFSVFWLKNSLDEHIDTIELLVFVMSNVIGESTFTQNALAMMWEQLVAHIFLPCCHDFLFHSRLCLKMCTWVAPSKSLPLRNHVSRHKGTLICENFGIVRLFSEEKSKKLERRRRRKKEKPLTSKFCSSVCVQASSDVFLSLSSCINNPRLELCYAIALAHYVWKGRKFMPGTGSPLPHFFYILLPFVYNARSCVCLLIIIYNLHNIFSLLPPLRFYFNFF